MALTRVAVGASSFGAASDEAVAFLIHHGVEVVMNPYGRRLTEAETIEHLQGKAGLLAGLEPLNETVFRQCPELRAVARVGIGMDNVDQEAAKHYGIKVSNTPEGPTQAVAEMTLTALLALIHWLPALNQDVHAGSWKKRLGKSIRGLHVLVVGYGRIGRAVAKLLRSMGAEVRAYDKYLSYKDEDGDIPLLKSLEEGLVWAEAVTFHVSGTDEVMGEQELALLAEGTYVLNSARGHVINEDALYDALQSGRLAGFWGDALWQEPYHGKLRECRNAILTPHASTYTDTCRASMEMQAAQNLLRDLGLGE